MQDIHSIRMAARLIPAGANGDSCKHFTVVFNCMKMMMMTSDYMHALCIQLYEDDDDRDGMTGLHVFSSRCSRGRSRVGCRAKVGPSKACLPHTEQLFELCICHMHNFCLCIVFYKLLSIHDDDD